MSRCKTCGQSIQWAVTEAGKKVPLDHPPENRFVKTNRHLPDQELHVRMTETYISHFATCPQADQHRKDPLRGQQQSLKENLRGQEQDDG